jgi:hypothetical protein
VGQDWLGLGRLACAPLEGDRGRDRAEGGHGEDHPVGGVEGVHRAGRIGSAAPAGGSRDKHSRHDGYRDGPGDLPHGFE